ncbi:MAG: pyridoxamine 5'-phosphate oxidase family protein [Pyrinomonadaceae bacterium]
MSHKFFDLTFTPSVKRAQEHFGTRRNYERFEGGEPDFHGLTEAEVEFIAERDGFYLSTVGEFGQPYVQFRGGPAGFLKVLDLTTLGYADFGGNLQYISTGNLAANDRAALILMDYANQRRLKILARVEISDAKDSLEMIAKLKIPGYKAKIERAVILRVEAFDWNCPRHITPRYTVEEMREINQPLYEHIEKLETEIEQLKKLPHVTEAI